MSNHKNDDSGPGPRGCMAIFASILLTPLAMWGVIALDFSFITVTLKTFAMFFFLASCIFMYKYIFTEEGMIDINNRQKEKEIKKNKFYYFCDLTDGNGDIGVLEVRDSLVSIKYKNGNHINYVLSYINDIEVIQSENANIKHGVGSMALGGIIVGPLGAVAGASAGLLFRECKFLIKFQDGNIVACKSLLKTFDDFKTYYKIKQSLTFNPEINSPKAYESVNISDINYLNIDKKNIPVTPIHEITNEKIDAHTASVGVPKGFPVKNKKL